MREEISIRDRWVAQGKEVAVATVVRVSGSAPRPVGSKFLASSSGDMAGSVSGGCIENDVFLHLQNVIETGVPKMVTYGIADDDAFAVGLGPGPGLYGTLVIDDLEAVARLIAAEEFGSRATAVAGPAIGQSAVIREGTLIAGALPFEILPDVLSDANALLDRERSMTLTYGTNEIYIESLVPRPHLTIFGAVHIAQELVPMAKRLGFHVVVSDARAAFTTSERFPDADALLIGWPDQVDLVFDRRSYVVVLSHDARFEDPLWPLVLKSPVAYIGAMGSSKTAQRRRAKLLAEGFDLEQVERIHGPIGLKIGAETPAEVAVAILAEIVETRAKPGVPLELRGRVTEI